MRIALDFDVIAVDSKASSLENERVEMIPGGT